MIFKPCFCKIACNCARSHRLSLYTDYEGKYYGLNPCPLLKKDEEKVICNTPAPIGGNEELKSLGPFGTKVRLCDFAALPRSSGVCFVRTLMKLVFERNVLGTHSMTGKSSNGKCLF